MQHMSSALLLLLLHGTLAAPASEAVPVPVAVLPESPTITPAPSLVDRTPTPVKRDLASYLSSVFSSLGSNIPTYVASGVPNFFQDFPTGGSVQSSLSMNDSQVAALPTNVLNLPSYANWTNQGWNLRIHGNVYKKPNISQEKLDELANGFLVGTSLAQLPVSQANQARNLTAEIYVLQQDKQQVVMNLVDNYATLNTPNGALTPAKGGAQTLTLPYNTTAEGDFDVFVQLANTTGPSGGYLMSGNSTTQIQAMNIYATGSSMGNASAYLVPTQGLTIVSDIDDILRVTKIYEPAEGLLNSFARPFTPWMNMPEIYANWSNTIPDFHFHYLTTTPEQITANYMDFIYNYYPLGSFDTRPLNFSNVDETLSVRKYLLEKVFQTFPDRKFILIADTSNSDVMKDYPLMMTEFPGQVKCIFLRNTSSTDSGDKFPYDTSGFAGLNSQAYMFFNVPDDLKGLDVLNGQCVNATIKQNITFSEQGLPFGISTNGSNSSAAGLIAMGENAYGASIAIASFAVLASFLFSML